MALCVQCMLWAALKSKMNANEPSGLLAEALGVPCTVHEVDVALGDDIVNGVSMWTQRRWW